MGSLIQSGCSTSAGTDAHVGAPWSVPVTVTGHCGVTLLGIAAGLVIWAGGIMPAYALNTGSPLQVLFTYRQASLYDQNVV